jgi:outer membrane lipoprotein-sorting protein
MRWFMMLPAISMVVPASVQDNLGEKLFEAYEQRLASAKAVKVVFQSDESQANLGAIHREGEMILATGNKFKVEIQGKDFGESFAAIYVADGKHFCSTCKIRGETTIKIKPVFEEQSAVIKENLYLFGITNNFAVQIGALVGKPGLPGRFKLKSFRLVGKEKLGDIEAHVVEYGLLTDNKLPKKQLRKMWFDAKSGMPLKRVLESGSPDRLYKVVEHYRSWDLDFKLSGDEFLIPK